MPDLAPGTALNTSIRTILPVTTGTKKQMSIDDFKNGERINCNGVYGTVIGKRSTRSRSLVLVKMDNGFTIKLNPHTVSVRLPEAGAIAQLKNPIKQLASVD